MPFRKWAVQPVHLCRSSDPEKKYASDFDVVYQRSLVHGLRQLANIARLADKIFDELVGECRLAVERTDRLRLKVEVCQDAVTKLNAKSVEVPVSDLNTTFKFLRRQKPFRTVYEMPTQLFLPSNRPPCVDTLYNEAAVTPVSLICTIDKYRTDGRTSSELFMVTPILGGATRRKRRKMLDIETRKPASYSLASQQESQELGISEDEVSVPQVTLSSSHYGESKSLDRLPSPEEQTMAISMEYPSTVVPVDTSGFSFLRMARCRRSLIHADFVIKRKKDKHKSKRRHTVCEGSSKELEVAVQNISMVNSSCQTESLPESGSFFSLRRSFCRKKSKHTDSTRRETVALDTLDLDSFRKSKGDVASTTDEDKATLKKDSVSGSKRFGKASSLMSRAANFNPISSLSAALSIAVKMRHSKSGKHDDGRSSSGNWSATSSTRASVDSDQHHIGMMVDRTSNVSRSSAGKDSVISDATQQESIRSQEITLGSHPNHPSKFPANKLGTDKNIRQWDFDQERGRESNSSTPERSSDCASTPLVMSPYTSRRQHNCYPPTSFDDGESSVYSVDTDGYYTSMHTDSGLWHSVIQNLRNGDNLFNDSIKCRKRQESQSSISTIGNSSINSFLSKTLVEHSPSNESAKQQFKLAPEPPPRTSSSPDATGTKKRSENVKGTDIQTETFDKDSSPTKNGSASESDHESGDRIRVKTTINPSRYPSMCAVSPETSDDELSDIEKTKPSNVSVVVAEVHQEEKVDTNEQQRPRIEDLIKQAPSRIYELKKNQHIINMYGNQSPIQSPFESSLVRPGEIVTSTPKHITSVSSFSTEADDSRSHSTEPSNVRRELIQDLELATKNISAIGEEFIITSPPVSPKNIPRNVEKTLIPLKYAQRITVTPIVRSETPDNISKPNSPRINSPTTKSRSFLKNPLGNLSFLQAENSKKKSPSYISFQSPDSPVSSSTSLSPVLSRDKSLSTTRAVARVTLDPSGKVIYSSSSLDRPKRGEEVTKFIAANNKEHSKYATLPKYQSPILHSQPIKNENKEINDKKETTNFSSCSPIPTSKRSTENIDFPQDNNFAKTAELAKPQNLYFRPSRGGRFCRTYFPSHLISQQPKCTNNNHILTSPPSPSSSIKSISSTSSQSSHGSKQLIEQIQPIVSSSPSNTCYALQNQRSVASTPPPITYQPSPTSYHHFRGNHNGIRRSCSNIPSSTSNLPSESQFKDIPNFAPSVSFKYQFRPMHFPQEMHATTAPYTASVPRQQQVKFGALKPPSPIAYSQLLSQKNLTYSTDDYCKTNVQGSESSTSTVSNPPDVIPSSSTPPSTLDITSRTVKKEQPTSVAEAKSPSNNNNDVKSLTPKELFAIIHDSKRKLNIKTESEKSSSPHISRSNSPSVMLSSPTIKSPRIETGTFVKQAERLSKIPQINKNVNSPEKSFDRRTKPTSMHDFKMLLLQTRVGTNEPKSKPSVAELLKVSPPKSSSPHQSPNLRPGAKTQNMNQSGYITIPVKRNMRTRSPYLTRYDSAYPPIWEDCSEELEADENQNQISYVSNTQSLTKANIYSQNSDNNNTLNPQAASTWV